MRPSVENIKKFESLNNNKFAINVYKWTDEHVTGQGNPFITVECISKNMNPDAIPINLAVLNACVDGIEKWHYVLINNFDRLMNIRVSHGKSNINIQQKWCPRCARAFREQKSLDAHKLQGTHFLKFGPITYETSTYDTLEFRDWQKMVSPSYIVYADFETVLERIDNQIFNTNTILQKHVPLMATYLFVPIQQGAETLNAVGL